VQRANTLLAKGMNAPPVVSVDGASHFMIATHAPEIARLISEHVHAAEASGT
jgi:hypothetical protein